MYIFDFQLMAVYLNGLNGAPVRSHVEDQLSTEQEFVTTLLLQMAAQRVLGKRWRLRWNVSCLAQVGFCCIKQDLTFKLL